MKNTRSPILIGLLIVSAAFQHSCTQNELSPEEARAIAREAYIYANPVVDSYRILYSYFIDTEHPDFKAPWNQIMNIPRVYTHEDRAVQTPQFRYPVQLAGDGPADRTPRADRTAHGGGPLF